MKKVLIRKVGGRDLDALVAEGLDAAGLRARLFPGARVFLKPNIVTDVPAYIENGANTDARVIRAVLRYLRPFGVRVQLGEADTGTELKGRKLRYALEQMGIRSLEEEFGLEVVNLTYDEKRVVDAPGSRILKKIPLAVSSLDADVIIDLPKIKTHKYAQLTCGIKNLFGMIPDPRRVRYHKHLHQVLAELGGLFGPRTIVLVDGLRGMEGNGPLFGEPVDLDLLMFTDDLLAADATAARLIGLDPASIDHLARYQAQYAGYDWSEIAVEGDVTEFPYRVFKPSGGNLFVKIEGELMRHPILIPLFFSDGFKRYVAYPLRGIIGKLRGGSYSWYIDREERPDDREGPGRE
jgi:uncharacterized protein (DUF362 family)